MHYAHPAFVTHLVFQTIFSSTYLIAEVDPNTSWLGTIIGSAAGLAGAFTAWYKTRQTAEHKRLELQAQKERAEADRKKQEAEEALKRAEEDRKKTESLAEIDLKRLGLVFGELRDSLKRTRTEHVEDRANAAAAHAAATAQIDKLQEDLARLNDEHSHCREDNARLTEKCSNQERRLSELEHILKERGLVRYRQDTSSGTPSTIIQSPPSNTPPDPHPQ